MDGRNIDLMTARALDFIDRRWKIVVVAAWLIFAAWFLYERWLPVNAFSLGDTDDNLRMSQVRAWIHGQGWFDLRQYRLNPPTGANIHWSRLVDLPIAGMILLFRPMFGGPIAEKIAVAAAPLLPLLLFLFAVALIVRRLVDRRAYPLALVALTLAASTSNMFMPLRIDHHGWQLAFLMLGMAGIADPKRARGGTVLGIATALSLAIGLELLIYLALAGAAMALFWVFDRGERERLSAYAVAVGGGTALAYALFASYANRAPVCDALSPVWLSDAVLGPALLFGLAWLSPAKWQARLALAVAGGLVVAAFHALSWPQCLQRLEGVSPEVEQLWLSHVREARPLYRHGWRLAAGTVALPIVGLVGWAVLAWFRRRDKDALRRILAIAVPALTSVLLLLWQTRTGPAAQAFALTGAAALVWLVVPLALDGRSFGARVAGGLLILVGAAGLAVPTIIGWVPAKPPTKREAAIGKANRQCNSMGGMRGVALQPRGLVFTFVDLGPRLITVTHQNAIAGPYHRNGEQIGDIMKAFRGSAEQARAIIVDKYHADYVLTCPNSSTTTIFAAQAPKGFYQQLVNRDVPLWLEPVTLPPNSPFEMWKVLR